MIIPEKKTRLATEVSENTEREIQQSWKIQKEACPALQTLLLNCIIGINVNPRH
jgi:hypothetical protein